MDKWNMVQCIPMTPIKSEPGEYGGLWLGPNKEESQNSRGKSRRGNNVVYLGGAICGEYRSKSRYEKDGKKCEERGGMSNG